MSYQSVKAYFDQMGKGSYITSRQQTGDTVEHAAEAIGCTPAEIAKAISFLVGGKTVMVVMAGDARVNSSKFKTYFHEKPGMIPREQVEALVGHALGGVCPFAVREGVPVYLDISLRRFAVVHTAAGTDMATIRLTPAELEEYSHAAGWVDVCKGWLADEGAARSA